MRDTISKKGVGIAGYKCPCCGPSPKNRKKFRRRIRARYAEKTRNILKNI